MEKSSLKYHIISQYPETENEVLFSLKMYPFQIEINKFKKNFEKYSIDLFLIQLLKTHL